MTALGTRLLTISIGGTDYTATVSNCRITAADAGSDFTAFQDAANGGSRLYQLAFTAVQDPSTGSLWDQVFTVPGTTVACILKPAGGATVDATHPKFTFNAIISEPDGDFLGGEANVSSTARFTFDCAWDLTAKPIRSFT